MKILWSPLAIERVSEIAVYIARDNPDAAENWVNTIFKKVEGLKSLLKAVELYRKPTTRT